MRSDMGNLIRSYIVNAYLLLIFPVAEMVCPISAILFLAYIPE